MAVTIQSSPNEVIAAHNCARWCLSIDDIGTPPDSKNVIGFQLIDELGNPLHALEVINPRAAGFHECIPYKRNIENLVYTSVPIIGVNTATEDPTAYKKIKLKYGEINYDFVTCETLENIVSESTEHILLNCAFPEYFNPFIGDTFVMSNRPNVMDFNNDSLDWIWVYGTASVNITAYNKAGTSTNIGTVVTDLFPVTIVPVGRGHYGMPAGTVRYRVRITYGAVTRDIWYFEKCQDCKRYNEVLFLERYGGRCTVLFDCNPVVSISSSYQEIFKHTPCFTAPGGESLIDQNVLSRGGRTISQKQSWESVTLRKFIPNDMKYIEFYKEFLASNSYHLRMEKNSLERGYIKFLVESGSIRIYQDQEEPLLEITGRYHLSENMAGDLK
jgi:hypothetical protein